MKMKKEFHSLLDSTASVLGWTLTWALMIFGWVAIGQPVSNAGTQGRVHMQIEDLKNLISLDARNPSAERSVEEWNVASLVQDELGSDSTLTVALSGIEKARLSQKLARIVEKQEKAIALAEKEYTNALASIKDKRKELQVQRLNTDSAKSDTDTSKRIFENVLEEANLSALKEAKISRIKEQSFVTVVFKDLGNGQRKVESIVAGTSTLWGRNSSGALAYRQ